jgi:hypothetical protein
VIEIPAPEPEEPGLPPLPNEDPAPASPEIDDPNRKERIPENDPPPEQSPVNDPIPRA